MEREGNIIAAARAERGVQLLEMLAEQPECTIAALSRRAGIGRYQTMRLLAYLESKGLVRGTVQQGSYQVRGVTLLGRQLLRDVKREPAESRPAPEVPAGRHDQAVYLSIVQDCRPVMESLARQHKEAMYLTVLARDEVLFLDMADCDGKVQGAALVGKRFPFFSNAAGKVMRAIDSWDLLEKIAKSWRRGRVPFPDLAELRAELELIRERGVAVDCGGMGDGIITVAVAVRDYAGKVVGAVTMLGPSFRLLGERLEQEIIPSLRLSGELLSMKFGYVRP